MVWPQLARTAMALSTPVFAGMLGMQVAEQAYFGPKARQRDWAANLLGRPDQGNLIEALASEQDLSRLIGMQDELAIEPGELYEPPGMGYLGEAALKSQLSALIDPGAAAQIGAMAQGRGDDAFAIASRIGLI